MLILSCKHKWIVAIVCGSLLSSSIEVIQLISHRGLFEFDDIIHNTLGTVIGIGMFLFISRAGKRLIGKI
jgi:glycopeptide antibiotics resistance protein